MNVIDLTHTIREAMPVYPGTESPRLTAANTYERDGFKETLLRESLIKSNASLRANLRHLSPAKISI